MLGIFLYTCILFESKFNKYISVFYKYTFHFEFHICFSKQDAFVIFRDAAFLNMTEYGHVWIVTEQALDTRNVPVGTIGLKLVHATNERAHIQDSM